MPEPDGGDATWADDEAGRLLREAAEGDPDGGSWGLPASAMASLFERLSAAALRGAAAAFAAERRAGGPVASWDAALDGPPPEAHVGGDGWVFARAPAAAGGAIGAWMIPRGGRGGWPALLTVDAPAGGAGEPSGAALWSAGTSAARAWEAEEAAARGRVSPLLVAASGSLAPGGDGSWGTCLCAPAAEEALLNPGRGGALSAALGLARGRPMGGWPEGAGAKDGGRGPHASAVRAADAALRRDGGLPGSASAALLRQVARASARRAMRSAFPAACRIADALAAAGGLPGSAEARSLAAAGIWTRLAPDGGALLLGERAGASGPGRSWSLAEAVDGVVVEGVCPAGRPELRAVLLGDERSGWLAGDGIAATAAAVRSWNGFVRALAAADAARRQAAIAG